MTWRLAFIAILAWSGILLIYLVPAHAADTCRNPSNWRELLPPAKYQHEPHMAFRWASSAKLMKAIAGVVEPGWIAYGHYGVTSKVIYICPGLTGKALWAVRMHEEAHAMGWRHPER